MVNDILRMHTVLESLSIQVGTSKNKINNFIGTENFQSNLQSVLE